MASEIQEEAIESLERVQKFEVEQLPRKADLGTGLNFQKAVGPARTLIELYNQLPASALSFMPENFQQQVKQQADADFQKLNQPLEFDPSTEANPAQVRDNYVNAIAAAYQPAFTKLHPFIAYGVSRVADFQRLETDARAAVQAARDDAAKLIGQLEESKGEAAQILEEVRRVAAEQGVSQQAIFFKDESAGHQTLADAWESRTMWAAGGLGLYAIASLFIHKIPLLIPKTPYDAFQLLSSNVLIFGVLSYLFFLADNNFLSHKHNSIVNKHRQNALMTFKALADAAGSEESRDVVLTHAASSIFSPQDTGYTKSGSPNGVGRSLIEIMPKAIANGSE